MECTLKRQVSIKVQCVQKFDVSRDTQVTKTYRILPRSSSIADPRDPLPGVKKTHTDTMPHRYNATQIQCHTDRMPHR